MKKEFVMRGQTATGKTEILHFSGHKRGYAYRLTEFQLYPATGIGTANQELVASITAGKTAVAPTDPDFNNEGLIAVSQYRDHNNLGYQHTPSSSVINDTYLITQNLILMVQDTNASNPINWQCKFEAVKISGPEEAVTNYKQYLISDE